MNILITGASQGIGYELGKLLLSQGHTVWGVGRRNIEVPFIYSSCDVSNLKSVQSLRDNMRTKSFFPNIIIINAAIFENDIHPNFNYERARHVLNINLFGALNVVEVFLPEMLTQKQGHLIAISSIAAFPSGVAHAPQA